MTPRAVERFVAERLRMGYRSKVSPKSMRPLLRYLGGLGMLPAGEGEPLSPVERLVAEFRDYLLVGRGATPGTVGLYEPVARLFLEERSEPTGDDLACLSGEEIHAFVLREARRRGQRSAETMVCALRSLQEAVNDYLALRRALGYKLEREGRLLPQFLEFLEQQEATVITTQLALAWATQPADASVAWWHERLSIVRGFARNLQASHPRTEVPAADRFMPHLCGSNRQFQRSSRSRRSNPALCSPWLLDRLALHERALASMPVAPCNETERPDPWAQDATAPARRRRSRRAVGVVAGWTSGDRVA